MRNSIVDYLYNFVANDKDIILLTGDLGFGVLDKCMKDFPDQFINVGIAEQNLTGLATGLGLLGKKVLTYSIGNFNTLRCLEQIRNDAAYHEVNMTIISVGGGFSYGQLGYSHHATEDYGIMRTLPNVDVYTPGSKFEAILSLKESLSTKKVSYLRIDKSHFDDKYCKSSDYKLGVNEIVRGEDALIIGVGGIVDEGIKCSDKIFLETKKRPGVVSISKLKKLDYNKLLKIMMKYDQIITIEEHNKINGLGSIIKEILFDNNVQTKFKSLGMEDVYSTVVGDQFFLRRHYKLTCDDIFKKINY
jgi:transketolase